VEFSYPENVNKVTAALEVNIKFYHRSIISDLISTRSWVPSSNVYSSRLGLQ